MTRKDIGTQWDRDNRNAINDNFKELYKSSSNVGEAVEKANEAKQKADSVQKQFDQVVIEGDSSVEAAQARVKADGTTFGTLRDRLNSSDYILNNKRDKDVKINKFDYDLGQDANKWNINDFDEDTRQTFLEAQGIDVNYVLGNDSVTRENYADKSVYPEKTTFAESKNLARVISGLGFSGGFGNYSFSSIDGARSIIARVKKGGTYTISATQDSDRFRLVANAGFPVIGETPTRQIRDFSGNNRLETITMQGDENHIIIYAATKESELPAEFQIEEGSERTEHALPGKKIRIDLDDKSVPSKALSDISEVFKTTGILVGQDVAFDVSLENENITTRRGGGFLFVENERYQLIDGTWSYSDLSVQSIFICFNKNNSNIIFLPTAEKIPENLILIGLIRRNTESYHVSGFHTLEGRFIKPYTGDDNGGTITSPDIFIADKPKGNYFSSADQYYDHEQRDVNMLYGLYDDLVSDYPGYISRTHLADDESGTPIYRYDFTPPVFDGYKHPKIVYSHPHGHETMAAYSAFSFFEEMCTKWEDDELLRSLRWNFQFVVIPTLNPWGISNNNRKNYNGVDLNRNFPSGWTYIEDEMAHNYAGVEPLSEVGSQVMFEIMQNENDVLFAIDHHNFGPDADNGNPFWIGSSDSEIRDTIFTITQYLSYHFTSNYDIPSDVDLYYKVNDSVSGGVANEWVAQGKKGMILENVYSVDGSFEEGQRFTLDVLGNTILSFIRKYTK